MFFTKKIAKRPKLSRELHPSKERLSSLTPSFLPYIPSRRPFPPKSIFKKETIYLISPYYNSIIKRKKNNKRRSITTSYPSLRKAREESTSLNFKI